MKLLPHFFLLSTPRAGPVWGVERVFVYVEIVKHTLYTMMINNVCVYKHIKYVYMIYCFFYATRVVYMDRT